MTGQLRRSFDPDDFGLAGSWGLVSFPGVKGVGEAGLAGSEEEGCLLSPLEGSATGGDKSFVSLALRSLLEGFDCFVGH